MARILTVDDDVQVRAMLRQMLERAGYEVVEAPNGEVALELLRQKQADLVITDLIMPGKEGIETIIELRRDYPDVKVIAVCGGTRAGAEDYLHAARLLGAHRTFVKPLDRKEIIQAIEELLGKNPEGSPRLETK